MSLSTCRKFGEEEHFRVPSQEFFSEVDGFIGFRSESYSTEIFEV